MEYLTLCAATELKYNGLNPNQEQWFLRFGSAEAYRHA